MQSASKLLYYIEANEITNDNCIEKMQGFSSDILYEMIYDPKIEDILSPENVEALIIYYWVSRPKHYESSLSRIKNTVKQDMKENIKLLPVSIQDITGQNIDEHMDEERDLEPALDNLFAEAQKFVNNSSVDGFLVKNYGRKIYLGSTR